MDYQVLVVDNQLGHWVEDTRVGRRSDHAQRLRPVRVLPDLPVQVGELEDLRDERVGDLERGLPLAVDAQLHGAAGGRALRDGEQWAACLARNVSWIPPPGSSGQEATGPIVDSWRLSTSAASRRTTARSVIVTGAGGRLTCGSRLGSWVIVTTRAAGGTRSGAGRGGCQLTWASTRIAVCPWPTPATSTTRSRAFSTPGIGDSENVRSHDGGPKSASSGVKRRGQVRLLPGQYRLRLAGRPPEGDVVHQRGGD